MNSLATIEIVSDVFPHGNADSLECLTVRNCTVIVPKDKYARGEKVLFIWPDSILPELQWSEFYRARSSRVRAIKLRGVYSFGIVEKLLDVPSSIDLAPLPVGTDVADAIGVTKYEPPPPKDLQAKGNLPYGIPKTDEENHYKFDVLPYGELCTVTRKRDGSSCSFYYHLESDSFGVLSRSLELKPDCHNGYTEHVGAYDIASRLRSYCQEHGLSLCIRGESFGNGRNGHKANVDAKELTAWEMFSVWDMSARRYISLSERHNFIAVAKACGFRHVPILEENVVLTRSLVQTYAEGNIGFEGVVVHVHDRTFKIINKEYDSRK